MEFMTIKEAAEKWNLSVRRVQTICNEGMIEGAMKFGNTWAIPKNAVKPVDKRIKSGKYISSPDFRTTGMREWIRKEECAYVTGRKSSCKNR